MSINRDTADWGRFQPQRRNIIINGGFDINQRGISTTFGSGAWPSDHWIMLDNTNDTGTFSIETFTPGQTDVPGNPRNYLRTTLTAGSTGSLNDLRQRIENVWIGAGQQITLSYWIKGSVAYTQGNRRIGQTFGAGGSTAVTKTLPSIDVTTSWQRIVSTVTLDSISGKTIGSDSYLDVILGLPVNTTVTVDIANVQFEISDEATDFEYRFLGEELALCQKFFQRATSTCLGYGYATSTTSCRIGVPLVVTLRSDPGISQSDGVLTNVRVIGRGVQITVTAVTLLALTDTNVTMTLTVASGLVAFEGYQLYKSSGEFWFDAEIY